MWQMLFSERYGWLASVPEIWTNYDGVRYIAGWWRSRNDYVYCNETADNVMIGEY